MTTTNMQFKFNFEQLELLSEKITIWKGLISQMTTEEIEKRSLLVGLSPATEENEIFQNLLTKEYNKRK